jgi:hypothetical protein
VPPTLVPLMNGKPSAVSHSSQHADFSSFSRKEVAVIGSGQSALESAALLHEAGANVHLFARRPKVLWATPPDGIPRHWRRRVVKPPSSLGPGWSLYVLSRAPGFVRWLPDEARLFLVRKVLGPSGAWWLRDRVIGRINLTTDSVLESAALIDDRVVLRWRDSARRSREVVVDHVLAATGYRSNIDSLDFIDEDLRRRVRRVSSSPRLRHSFESSVPGLLFAGLSAAATFGPVLRFVCGADFAAHRITAALSERAKDS